MSVETGFAVCRKPDMIGGTRMTAGSAAWPAEGADGEPSAERALELLRGALDIFDTIEKWPDVGARVQEAIDALESKLAD